MKLLQETIRNMIMENASILDTLPVDELQSRDLIIVADMQAPQSEIDVYLCKMKDYDEEFGEVTDYFGMINISNIGKRTMQVSMSNVDDRYRRKGFGALLYNVALALCTSENLWLMSDRQEVSSKAERVWNTWAKMPDEYEIHQTDHRRPSITHYAVGDDYDPDVDYFLTKTAGDDFDQGSFQDNNRSWGSYDDSDPRAQLDGDMVKDWWYFFDDKYKKDFLASALTKRFKMKDAKEFINVLESIEVLYRMNQ